MMRVNLKVLGMTTMASLVLTGCVVRGPYYGYRRPVVVQETVVTSPPPVYQPPVGYQQSVAPAPTVSPAPGIPQAPPPGQPPPVTYSPPPAIGTEMVVTAPPPPPVQTEIIYASPGPGFFWVGGAWVWRGAWLWEPGHWVRPPRRGVVWVPHHYENRGGVHIWISGGWR